MKQIIFTSAMFAATIWSFGQIRNGSTNTNVTHSNSNFSTNTNSSNSNITHQSNTHTNSSIQYNSNTRSNTSSNDNTNVTNNSNNTSNGSNSSNNSWSNSNSSNSSNNSWNNNNGYYNNNNGYNNSNYYGNNNNSYYTTTNTPRNYEGNFGSDVITGNKGFSKNPYNITNRNSNYKNKTAIDKFFTKNQKPSQIFTINAQTQNTVKANDGTIIKIEPNTFVRNNGDVFTGDVNLEVKEMYNRSDMVFSNASTVSNDMPLISGGEVYIDARSKDGEVLRMDDNKPMAIEMPARIGTKDEMQLFYGEAGNNSVNWNLANANTVAPVANSNVSTGSSYNFNTTAMGWINCDKFMRSNNPGTKVRVDIPRAFDTTNTAVFLVFSGQNTVTRCDYFKQLDEYRPNNFYTRWYSVPVGTEVTVVSISEINGEYYSAFNHTFIGKDHVENLNPSPTTLEIFKKDMENLR